jgi:hypothetical protein
LKRPPRYAVVSLPFFSITLFILYYAIIPPKISSKSSLGIGTSPLLPVLHSYQFDCGHTVDIDNDQYRHVDSRTIPGW